MAFLKLAVIGGSSYYTPGLIEALNESDLRVELVLNGRSKEKLTQVTEVCQNLAQKEIDISMTTDLKKALDGADFVLLQVRIGGMEKRGEDESFPKQFNLVGEETILPGGASLAVRTLPYLEEFSKTLLEVSPNAKVMALTNPNNMVIDYFNRYLGIDAIGFCDLPTSLIRGVVEAFTGEKKGIEEIWPEISFKYYGINHLAFLGDINYKNKEIDIVSIAPKLGLDPLLVETLGLLPVSYLRYYYSTSSVLEIAKDSPTRGEVLAKQEETLKEDYQKAAGKKPQSLSKRPVPWYKDVVVPYLKASLTKGEMILVTQNKGALADLKDDSVAELPVIIKRGKIHRLYQGSMPSVIKGLVVSVSESERLIVDGIAKRSPKIFRQGLIAHPLIREYKKAEAVMEEIKRIDKVKWL